MNKRPCPNNECMVCMDEITDSLDEIKTKCGHIYCLTCFVYHMRVSNSCGYCRTELVAEKPKELPTMDDRLIINMTDHILNNFQEAGGMDVIYTNLSNKFKAYIGRAIRETDIRITRNTNNVIEECLKIIPNLNLDFAMWAYTLESVQAVANWYENDVISIQLRTTTDSDDDATREYHGN